MRTVLIVLSALILSACSLGSGSHKPALRTVDYVDLDRYMGEWYIIANIPYFAERGNVAGRAVYSWRDDGNLNDIYLYRESFDEPEEKLTGKAWIEDETSNAYLKVRFYWPFTFDYYIIGLDDDYRYVAIGHPSRDYGWIMAREPRMPDAVYEEYLQIFADQHYDTADFAKVPQFPEQLGQPGFQDD
ncbi:MAG: lipocalin family protein [Wenzhouxiangellaceae bacterium]